MSRALAAAAVAVALALPVLALAALIGEQEQARARATIVTVPLRGYDPRDLLRGHYLNSQLDWDWDAAPAVGGDDEGTVTGGLCVLTGDAVRPRVRFVAGWAPGDAADPACRVTIAGHARKGRNGVPTGFTPSGLDDGDGGLKLFVPETRALELEETMRDRPGALAVDLAVRADGNAALGVLRIDGQPLGKKALGR